MRPISATLIALSLVACAPQLQVVTPGTVMLSNVGHDNAATALAIAEQACAVHGRHAVPIPDNIRDGQQTYECKD